LRIKNEYALIAGILVAFFHSYIASLFDLGIRVSGIHIHHFYFGLVLLPILFIIHMIKHFGIYFRNVPIWLIYFFYGLFLSWLVSEIIFVGQHGFIGYLYFD
jgi:hypothetical protein